MTAGTHTIFNQAPPYGGQNLFASDPLLDGATSGFPDPVRQDLLDVGQVLGQQRCARTGAAGQPPRAGTETGSTPPVTAATRWNCIRPTTR